MTAGPPAFAKASADKARLQDFFPMPVTCRPTPFYHSIVRHSITTNNGSAAQQLNGGLF